MYTDEGEFSLEEIRAAEYYRRYQAEEQEQTEVDGDAMDFTEVVSKPIIFGGDHIKNLSERRERCVLLCVRDTNVCVSVFYFLCRLQIETHFCCGLSLTTDSPFRNFYIRSYLCFALFRRKSELTITRRLDFMTPG